MGSQLSTGEWVCSLGQRLAYHKDMKQLISVCSKVKKQRLIFYILFVSNIESEKLCFSEYRHTYSGTISWPDKVTS